jgi:3-mercaptopropionate dioxygenase
VRHVLPLAPAAMAPASETEAQMTQRPAAGPLQSFFDRALACSAQGLQPCDAVLALVGPMMELATSAPAWIDTMPLQCRPEGYTRNLLHCAPDGSLSLYALVWLPGQWTPVHDHGSWGVVGILEGVLEERSHVRLSPDDGRDEGIVLARGSVVLLPPGAVSTFVPNPDHIHVTGVPADRQRAVSLHLYGRTMSDFNVYDVAAGTRRRIGVAHHDG